MSSNSTTFKADTPTIKTTKDLKTDPTKVFTKVISKDVSKDITVSGTVTIPLNPKDKSRQVKNMTTSTVKPFK
eukprot:12157568-Ditylum_brightwellii.AAC.1